MDVPQVQGPGLLIFLNLYYIWRPPENPDIPAPIFEATKLGPAY